MIECGYCNKEATKGHLTYGLSGPYIFPVCDDHGEDAKDLKEAEEILKTMPKEEV